MKILNTFLEIRPITQADTTVKITGAKIAGAKIAGENFMDARFTGSKFTDAVLDVYRQCEDFLALGPVPIASMEMVLTDIRTSQRSHGVFCGIYTADEKMIGIVDYIPENYENDPHAAFLSLLMIAAPFRKQGIGKAVVATVEDEIRKNPLITAILSGVQVNNPEAIRFWQNNGYRIVSGPTLFPDKTTAFGLRKDLSGS